MSLSRESFGERLARFRLERGLTQTELAQKIGLIQTLISAYEHDRLRLRADLAIRFAIALGVSTDELLGVKPHANGRSFSRRVLKRMRRIEDLSPTHQRGLLRTIDAYIAGVTRPNGG